MTSRIIGICDDQKIEAGMLQDLIVSLLEELDAAGWEVCVYTSPLKLLEDAGKIQILFLDIEMPELDGIEAGSQILQDYPDCRIIMATSRIDRFKDAFRIRAFRFITKPYIRDEVREALASSFDAQRGEQTIDMYLDRICYKIKEKNIQYIRAFNGYVEIIVGDRVYRKDVSLDSLEKILDKRMFFRVHRQYLINFRYVENYDSKVVEIKGNSLPVSKRRWTDFMKEYAEYDLNYS